MTKFTKGFAPTRRSVVKGSGALALGIAAPALLRIGSAFAAYPERPVKFVVANSPGGPSDIIARIVAAALQQSTGKTFIVENRSGAGGNIGMEYAARSEPDGYTILLATNAYSINYGLYNTVPYDPYKDFVAVSEVGGSPNIFVVKSDFPGKTMKDFVAAARASEKFNASTSPIGTTPQLQLEVLKSRDNLPKLEGVVFKGGGEAIEALLAGTVQMCSGSLAPSQPHIKSGSLRGLAICAEQRWPDLPDVPTMAEAGYPNFVFAVDAVLMAPAKTPSANVKWLEAETLKVLATRDIKDKFFQAGFFVRAKGADAAWDRVSKEIGLFKDVIDKASIKKL
jgi:tripartite-type tricarboxylate transporter receptor subunit TctC